ncbi:MAG: outer membrane lipoprotein carrier protein LolA [Planctomycetes bacterium]|nr:outer membrane lipoprotein carrier protein LolA [Planctomycetota bacterium]
MRRRAIKLSLLFCLAPILLSCSPADAQQADTPLQAQEPPPEAKRALDHLQEANAALKSVRARITYVRAIPLLDEKQKSRGELIYKKPDHIILKLGKPRNEEVYTNGKKWWVVSHETRQVEIYPVSDEANREAAFLRFGYGEGSEGLLKDYSVELVSAGQEPAREKGKPPVQVRRLRFRPRRKKKPAPLYDAIEVEISSENWLPRQFVLHEGGFPGEIIHTYTLRDVRLDTKLKDKMFEYKPPRGYTVLRPSERADAASESKGGAVP